MVVYHSLQRELIPSSVFVGLHSGPTQVTRVRMCASTRPGTSALHNDPTRRGDLGRTLHPLPRVPRRTHSATQGEASQ